MKLSVYCRAASSMNPKTEPTADDPNVVEVLSLKELANHADESDRVAYVAAIDHLNRTFIRARKCSPEDNEHGVIVSTMSWLLRITFTFYMLHIFNFSSKHPTVGQDRMFLLLTILSDDMAGIGIRSFPQYDIST
jgi:hypothetical protein